MRLRFSDDALHRSIAPADAVERLVFDWLEQFRVESLVPDAWPGVRANLAHRFEAWSLAFRDAGHLDGARGMLLYTMAQMARMRVTNDPVVEATEDLMEGARFALGPRIGHALVALRRQRLDQAAYAVPAREIASTVAAMLRDAGADAGGDDDASARARDDDARSVFGLVIDDDDTARDAAGDAGSAVAGRARTLDGAEDAVARYRPFTTAYDREEPAAGLVRAEELAGLRAQLDARTAAQSVNVPRIARALRAVFAVPARDGFDAAQDEGTIDGRALARLVASPADHRVFRRDRVEPMADAALTVLVDCSGSMKAHAETVAVLVDALARAGELAGVDTEVLGFTTGAWNGGRAMRDWRRAGKPAAPGRLNERLHLVFKPFDAPWRRARRGIAALLKPELFREGLDGEALVWAAARLRDRPAARRVLLVVSDGSPMDTATAIANGDDLLDRHLQVVADGIERRGDVELHALGVGLDLSLWYRSAHVLDLDARIGNAMFGEVLALIGGRPIHGTRPQP